MNTRIHFSPLSISSFSWFWQQAPVVSAIAFSLFKIGVGQGTLIPALTRNVPIVPRDAICPADVSECPNPFFSFEAIQQVKSACVATSVDPYLGEDLQGVGIPLAITPQYVHQVMHPGRMYHPKGGVGYRPDFQSLTPWAQVIDDYKNYQQQMVQFPSFRAEVQAAMATLSLDGRGVPIENLHRSDGSVGALLVGVSPLKIKNHALALSSIRDWIGQIETLSPKEVIRKLLQANGLLFQEMPNQGGGIFRRSNGCIFRDQKDDQDRSFQGLCRVLRSRGGTQDDLRLFQNIFTKRGISTRNPLFAFDRAIQQGLSDEEKRVVSWVCSPMSHWEHIPKQMIRFIEELQQSIGELRRCEKKDPIALGAFVHRKIVEIHPFQDGNGRIARAFMNAFLMEGGIEPVIFLSDNSYTDAVQREMREPGYFAEYLRKIAIPQKEHAFPFFEDPL